MTWEEISTVEVANLTRANATCHYRNMVDEGVRRHCRHRRVDTLFLELGGHVPLPYLDHRLLLWSKVTIIHNFSTLLLCISYLTTNCDQQDSQETKPGWPRGFRPTHALLLFLSVRNENGLSGPLDFASPGQELAIQVICRANVTNQPRRCLPSAEFALLSPDSSFSRVYC